MTTRLALWAFYAAAVLTGLLAGNAAFDALSR